jgi:hypothetical protein
MVLFLNNKGMIVKSYPNRSGFPGIVMREYYIHNGRIERGPFSLQELKSQYVRKDTAIWYEGLDNWTAAGNLNELRELFTRKLTYPAFPKMSEKEIVARNAILKSFSVAQESIPRPARKRSLVKPILIFFILLGILLLL